MKQQKKSRKENEPSQEADREPATSTSACTANAAPPGQNEIGAKAETEGAPQSSSESKVVQPAPKAKKAVVKSKGTEAKPKSTFVDGPIGIGDCQSGGLRTHV